MLTGQNSRPLHAVSLGDIWKGVAYYGCLGYVIYQRRMVSTQYGMKVASLSC